MDKDEILAEIARYVDDDEYQDPQEIVNLLSSIRAYILACETEAPFL
jgi:hypothetical protein